MGQQSQALAERFEQTNNDFIASVRAMTPQQWHTLVPDESCTAGVVAHHVGGAYKFQAEQIRRLAAGEDGLPINMEMIHDGNIRHREKHADCTREEVLDLLQRNGATALAVVRSIEDEQLERAGHLAMFDDRPVTPRFVIERNLIQHPQGHLQGIRAALGIV
jgi:hypothetical protein